VTGNSNADLDTVGLHFHSHGNLFSPLILPLTENQQAAFDGQLASQLSTFLLLLPSAFSAHIKLQILDVGYDGGSASSGALSVGQAELWWPPGAQVLPTRMQQGVSMDTGLFCS